MDAKIDVLEVAKYIGEPRDPRKKVPDIVSKLCDVSYAEPEDQIYYFDVLIPTDRVLQVTSTGAVTDANVVPDTPVLLTFGDYVTPSYYIKFTDYARRQESSFARINKNINTSLNSLETYALIQLVDAAATASSNLFTADSGQTTFQFPDLIDMREAVTDFGDQLVLLTGSTIDKNIILWDWTDNKYHSLSDAFEALNIEKVRIGLKSAARTFDYDAEAITGGEATTSLLPANVAYLIATSDEAGMKPFIFVRKRLNSIEQLGGVIAVTGDVPERLVIVTPNPVTPNGGTVKYLAVGTMGYEQIALACVNPYAVAKFTL